MALEGKQLGRYHIVRLLGSGGMGEVYLAEDPRIKQQVAIKVIRAEQSPYPNAPSAQTAVRLFQREARAIVALDHPRILPLHDYGEEQQGKTSLIYLVMPYRPEGSLVDWIQTHSPDRVTPPEIVAHLVSQAAEALQHAHEHQIIHMDVKPSNFLIRDNPKTPDRPDLLLADFGIAHISSATASTSQAIRGTPTYMAPEQCEGEAVPASDQYALAVMTYELLTGRPPFQGTSMRIMYQHVNTLPEPPSAHHRHLSHALDEVVVLALAKRPEERFPSVTAFATAFQSAVEALGIADASTIISGSPAPSSTNLLPGAPLISDSLANAQTRISSPDMPLSSDTLTEAATRISSPDVAAAPAPDTGSAEEAATPPAEGWAAASTGPTAAPPPETLELDQGKESNQLAPPALQGWTETTDAPTAPPLANTLSLGAEGAHRSGPIATPGSMESQRRGGKRRFILIAAAVLVMLALVGGGGAYALLSPTTATVTITPASQVVSNTYTLSAVTGTPDASKQQVGAQLLSVTTSAQSKTVTATGTGTIPGTHAAGQLLISSGASPLTLYAGATYPNNAGAGPGSLVMVLGATVHVNASSQVTVPAHVLQVGPIGNYSGSLQLYTPFASTALTIPFSGPGPSWFQYWPDPAASWFIGNSSNFTGGKDPQTYQAVAQSDIDNAAQALESANQPNPQEILQPQIKPNEQLVGTPQCTPTVSSDHQAGDQATQVTVSVTFTCLGEVYDHDGALTMAANLLTQQAATDPGGGFALVGKITTTLSQVTADSQGTVTITANAEGTWVYQFTDAQKHALARLIAGKSSQEAQQQLTSQPYVEKATIQLSGGGQTLPSDPSKITMVVLAVSGA